jgi:hypothetical protein
MNENICTNQKEEAKSIGALIPAKLYWQFKRIQAERKETATQAIENAIRLYIELDTEEEA